MSGSAPASGLDTTPGAASPIELLEAFLVTCNDSGLRWALLRGRSTLGLGRDTDLLVAREHQPAFEELVREAGGRVSPGRLHASHRSYRLGRPGQDALVLDVVTRLNYNRRLQIPSGLEDGCLDRRVQDGWLYALSPSDLFWTVLLHCLFDKKFVTARRAAELTETLHQLSRPSEGEHFIAQHLPAGWSPQRLVDCVEAGQWTALESLAQQLTPVTKKAPLARRHPAVGLDAVAGRVHGLLWSAAGLGAPSRVATVVDSARLPAVIIGLRRRPGAVSLVLLVPDVARQAVEAALHADGYRRRAGAWTRLTRAGLERVRLLSPARSSWSPATLDAIANESLPLAGRTHCRWAVGLASTPEPISEERWP